MYAIDMNTIDYLNELTNRLETVIYLLKIVGEDEERIRQAEDIRILKFTAEAYYFLLETLEDLHGKYQSTVASINTTKI